MEITYDAEVDCAYIALRAIAGGEAVEQVAIDRRGQGDVVLDFTRDGKLVGIEIIGASALLPAELVATARRLGPAES